ELANQALEIIKNSAGKDRRGRDNVSISMGYVGLIPSTYPINNIFLWTRGPEEAVLSVALRKGSGIHIEEVKRRLREELARGLRDWLNPKPREEPLPAEKIAERVQGLRLSFEPADIVNQVMSFGSPTPIEVVVSNISFTGPKAEEHLGYVERVHQELAKIRSLRDLQFAQSRDYPSVGVEVDRMKAGLSGVTATDVSRSLVSATSSSRFIVPIFWADPATGIGYLVQVEIPPYRMSSADEIGLVPVKGNGNNGNKQLLLRDVARISEGKVPGEYDRYNMQRLLSISANVEGEDLGRVASRIATALKAAGEPPRGVKTELRGQVAPMKQMFGGLAGGKYYEGLTLGLAMSVVGIFLLLTADFQSIRLALISVSAVPAVLAGVVIALLLTRTTLNLQSFMGAIMAIGVAVANAILLVTFAERSRAAGKRSAEAA